MTTIKLKPTDPRLRYLGIDVTDAIDTVAWGQVWSKTFGWDNLLWELSLDPADTTGHTRLDKAHAGMPIQWLSKTSGGQIYTDTVLMPAGVDGLQGSSSMAALQAGTVFMQTFLLNPRADKAGSSLSAGGPGVGADIIYISSHGLLNGGMFGGATVMTNFFEPAVAATTGDFAGPSWVILSNCSTLDPGTHGDWLKLMTGKVPLRGIVGFQHGCPDAKASVDYVGVFMKLLAANNTFLDSWRQAVTQKVSAKNWVVLCHTEAKGDTISDLNEGKLKAIPAGGDVLFFDDTHAGTKLVSPQDPYEAFWSKGGTRITVVNMGNSANFLTKGDTVTITVKPQSPAPTFTDKTPIDITLIYIRPDYPQNIDVTKMFDVVSRKGMIAGTPPTANLNPDSPGGDDSWKSVVAGTPTEVVLELKCKDLSMLTHQSDPVFMYLRVIVSGIATEFRRNGGITPKP
jgi:hypothetical protein